MAERLNGFVARLVTDDELLMNVGSDDGVSKGQIFAILDPKTRNVHDPKTGRDLGSLDREKARVAVIKVGEHLSLARIFPSRRVGLSGAAMYLSGSTITGSRLTSDTWPEGVEVMDPVVETGDQVKPRVVPSPPSPPPS